MRSWRSGGPRRAASRREPRRAAPRAGAPPRPRKRGACDEEERWWDRRKREKPEEKMCRSWPADPFASGKETTAMNAHAPRARENPGIAGAVPAEGWREPARSHEDRNPLTPALSPRRGRGRTSRPLDLDLDPDPRPPTPDPR